MNNIKIIAVDMDGTFLKSDNTYDKDRFMRQYQYMKKNNIHFVIASGNQYYQLRSFFPEIHHELTFVAENGAYIVDQGEDVRVAQLSKENVKKVIKVLDRYPEVDKVVCGQKSAYVSDNVSDEFYNTMNIYYHRLQRVHHFDDLNDTIFKFYLHCSQENFESIFNDLNNTIGNIMTPVDCGHFGIDLIIPGMNKAQAIAFLKQRWNLETAETMAFGDSGNDLEMLEDSTYSFAMANAKQSVQDVSDYVIASNDESGVLEVIDWLIHKENMFK